MSTPPVCTTSSWRSPRLEVVAGQTVLLELSLQEAFEEITHALVEFGIDIVMPLLDPRNELRQSRQWGLQTLRGPALAFHELGVPGR
jgi:hypothetical protein